MLFEQVGSMNLLKCIYSNDCFSSSFSHSQMLTDLASGFLCIVRQLQWMCWSLCLPLYLTIVTVKLDFVIEHYLIAHAVLYILFIFLQLLSALGFKSKTMWQLLQLFQEGVAAADRSSRQWGSLTISICVHLPEDLVCAFLRCGLVLGHLHHRGNHLVNGLNNRRNRQRRKRLQRQKGFLSSLFTFICFNSRY